MTTQDFVPNIDAAVAGITDTPLPDGIPDKTSEVSARDVPAKFLDPESGAVRVDALARSYRALEQRLSRGTNMNEDAGVDGAEDDSEDDFELDDSDDLNDDFGDGFGDREDLDAAEDDFPDDPEGYRIAASHPWIDGDAEVNELLHAAGFTQGQAQLVYDLAAEKVVPLIENLIAETGAQQQQARLARHFGDGQDFEKTAEDVAAWGKANLPAALFQTLAGTPDGIIAMRHLMRSGEPAFLETATSATADDEAELHTLMDDPKYWRDHDPDTVRRVQDGFRRLYPE